MRGESIMRRLVIPDVRPSVQYRPELAVNCAIGKLTVYDINGATCETLFTVSRAFVRTSFPMIHNCKDWHASVVKQGKDDNRNTDIKA